MSASVGHFVHDVLVPAVCQLVIILHESFLVDRRVPEPVIDVSAAIQPVRNIILIVNDPSPEIHSDRSHETVVSGQDLGGLLSGVSRSIRALALATYDTMSSLSE